mgnify:CR=1 FL=1
MRQKCHSVPFVISPSLSITVMITGAMVDERVTFGITAIHIAAQHGHDAFINTQLLHRVSICVMSWYYSIVLLQK